MKEDDSRERFEERVGELVIADAQTVKCPVINDVLESIPKRNAITVT